MPLPGVVDLTLQIGRVEFGLPCCRVFGLARHLVQLDQFGSRSPAKWMDDVGVQQEFLVCLQQKLLSGR